MSETVRRSSVDLDRAALERLRLSCPAGRRVIPRLVSPTERWRPLVLLVGGFAAGGGSGSTEVSSMCLDKPDMKLAVHGRFLMP